MLPIVKVPQPSLREVSKEVSWDVLKLEETQKFIDDMIPTMYDDDGIGLAAPQVGKNIRIFTVGKEALKPKEFECFQGTLDPSKDLVLINPIWYKLNKKTHWELEGCLSVPKTFGKVKRYRHIHVEAIDRHGQTISFDAHEYFARVIQHETDHLNGVLFIDKAKGIYTVD